MNDRGITAGTAVPQSGTAVPQSETAETAVRQSMHCKICGGQIQFLSDVRQEWPELRDGTLCELCWRAALDLYRPGTCYRCGRPALCKEVVGGLVCVDCYTGQDDPPPELERYGRCLCGRLERLQIADRVGLRYLCLRCSNAEQMTT